MTNIVWNFEDIDSNILAIEYDKKAIGYFRMDTSEFIAITDERLDAGPRIPIKVLRSIINGYDDALKEAKYIVKTALSA